MDRFAVQPLAWVGASGGASIPSSESMTPISRGGQGEACPPWAFPGGHGAKSAPLPTLRSARYNSHFEIAALVVGTSVPNSDALIKTVEALAKVLPVKDVYEDLAQPAFKQAGQLASDVVKTLQLALPFQVTASARGDIGGWVSRYSTKILSRHFHKINPRATARLNNSTAAGLSRRFLIRRRIPRGAAAAHARRQPGRWAPPTRRRRARGPCAGRTRR
jgi:hypothetical protein